MTSLVALSTVQTGQREDRANIVEQEYHQLHQLAAPLRGEKELQRELCNALLQECSPSSELLKIAKRYQSLYLTRQKIETCDAIDISIEGCALWVSHFEKMLKYESRISVFELSQYPLEFVFFCCKSNPDAFSRLLERQGLGRVDLKTFQDRCEEKLWLSLFPKGRIGNLSSLSGIFLGAASQVYQLWREYRTFEPSEELKHFVRKLKNTITAQNGSEDDSFYTVQYQKTMEEIQQLFLDRYYRLTSLQEIQHFTPGGEEFALDLYYIQTEFVLDQDQELSRWCRTPFIAETPNPFIESLGDLAENMRHKINAAVEPDYSPRERIDRQRLVPEKIDIIVKSIEALLANKIQRRFSLTPTDTTKLLTESREYVQRRIRLAHGARFTYKLAKNASYFAQAASGIWFKP